jgi:hypothetical protein
MTRLACFATLLGLASLSALACAKAIPTEEAFVVKAAMAPGLSEPEDDEPSARSLHHGDLVVFAKRGGPLRWAGTIDGEKTTREGNWIEVRRAPRDGGIYTFEGEIERVVVPAASWFCSTSPTPITLAGMSCAHVLNRIRVDDRRVVGFLPCSGEACPLGIVDGKATHWTTVHGLSSLELRQFAGRPLLFGRRGWRKGSTVSGTSLVLIEPSLGLQTLAEVEFEEIDARSPTTVTSRQTTPTLDAEGFTLVGARREVDRKTGTEVASTPIRERYRIDAQGHVSGP